MEIRRVNLIKISPRGVTMLELAIGIGVMTLLLFLSIPSFSLLRRNVALSNSSRELQSALRLAQTRAFVAQGGAAVSHSVQLGTDSYTIFGGSQPQTVYLPNGITVSGGAGQTITFTRLTGLPASSQEIILSAGGTAEQTVLVGAGGLISLP